MFTPYKRTKPATLAQALAQRAAGINWRNAAREAIATRPGSFRFIPHI